VRCSFLVKQFGDGRSHAAEVRKSVGGMRRVDHRRSDDALPQARFAGEVRRRGPQARSAGVVRRRDPRARLGLQARFAVEEGRSPEERRCSAVPEEDRQRSRVGGGGKLSSERRLDLSCLSIGSLAKLLGLGHGLRHNTNPVLRYNTNPVPQCTAQ
jgi:hypothetical protein